MAGWLGSRVAGWVPPHISSCLCFHRSAPHILIGTSSPSPTPALWSRCAGRPPGPRWWACQRTGAPPAARYLPAARPGLHFGCQRRDVSTRVGGRMGVPEVACLYLLVVSKIELNWPVQVERALGTGRGAPGTHSATHAAAGCQRPAANAASLSSGAANSHPLTHPSLTCRWLNPPSMMQVPCPSLSSSSPGSMRFW